MLEVLGEESGYDEYNERTVTIPLTLAGQENRKDEIVVDSKAKTVKYIQRYYKYEFSGQERWNVTTSSYSVNTTLASFSATGARKASNAVASALCNALPVASIYSKDEPGIYAISPGALNYAQIFVRISKPDATAEDFCEVLKEGTYLYYPMAEAIETDYTDTEWGQALLELTSDGETLTFDCDAETTITYNKDINKVIQKLTDAIIALGGTI